eukprot:329298-Pleurochrysis_carterae.AAC.1
MFWSHAAQESLSLVVHRRADAAVERAEMLSPVQEQSPRCAQNKQASRSTTLCVCTRPGNIS